MEKETAWNLRTHAPEAMAAIRWKGTAHVEIANQEVLGEQILHIAEAVKEYNAKTGLSVDLAFVDCKAVEG